MSEISKVIASEIADFFAGFGGPGEPDIQSGEAQRLLTERVLSVLALRERAEPVAYIIQDAEARDRGLPGFLSYDASINDEDINEYEISVTPLYTAPPAPVVPKIDRKAICNKVHWLCARSPGATFYNAAEYALDEVIELLAPPAPVDVPNELVSELLDIAKRAAEEADECANAEFSDNSMKHAREIAEWERRAAMLQPVSQPYKLPVGPQDESEPAKN
ncbi:hypothetical protein [Cronobacter sakazakii]|uniref:hypothetical protein n=1 Tax=Cronobacter sakazakii TaxID=28141 RepID=UPI001F362CA6|nr:hypothetical protein [Cronobacter sakazakii]